MFNAIGVSNRSELLLFLSSNSKLLMMKAKQG